MRNISTALVRGTVLTALLLTLPLGGCKRRLDGTGILQSIITRASLGITGIEPFGESNFASFSADGRYVAFQSTASNLVLGDTNGLLDVFVRDLVLGSTERVSVDSAGAQALGGGNGSPSISADGQFVAFLSDATNLTANVDENTDGLVDIYVHDRISGATVLASPAGVGPNPFSNGDCLKASISPDGRYVAFHSTATNLIGTLQTDGGSDIYVRDLTGATTELMTPNLGVGPNTNGGYYHSFNPVLSRSITGVLYVAFASAAGNLMGPGVMATEYQIYRRQVGSGVANVTQLVSMNAANGPCNGPCAKPTISEDGRYIAYISAATDLGATDVNGSDDIYLRDMAAGIGVASLVSVSSTGVQAAQNSSSPSISADGNFVAFHTLAPNLVDGDTNGVNDVFVRDVRSPSPNPAFSTLRVSVTTYGNQVNQDSTEGRLSGDGRSVVFSSLAGNLVTDDHNGLEDVFLRTPLP